MTRSNLVGCSTGMSGGLAPLPQQCTHVCCAADSGQKVDMAGGPVRANLGHLCSLGTVSQAVPLFAAPLRILRYLPVGGMGTDPSRGKPDIRNQARACVPLP